MFDLKNVKIFEPRTLSGKKVLLYYGTDQPISDAYCLGAKDLETGIIYIMEIGKEEQKERIKKLQKENEVLDATAKDRDKILAHLDSCGLNYYSTDFEKIGEKL